MDAGRYLLSNPGQWTLLDSFAKELLSIDLESASWVNLTLTGAQGRMNMRGDTVLTFPDFTKTHRLYTFQSYTPMSKSKYPKESTISERQLSTHYELQKSLPPADDEDEPQSWKTPFERGFLLQIGQAGTQPIDTDVVLRMSPSSRVKMFTNAPEKGQRINDVFLLYQLDTDKTSYEMGFSTANETNLKFVRSLRRWVAIGGEWYTKHYPDPKSAVPAGEGKKSTGRTESRATLAVRWSNLASGSHELLEGSPVPCPLEITGHVTAGHHYGLRAATSLWHERLDLAGSWKRTWPSKRAPIQKWALGLRLKFQLSEIPAFLKVNYTSYAGTAALFGVRLSGVLGIGIGVSYNHHTSAPQTALFLNL